MIPEPSKNRLLELVIAGQHDQALDLMAAYGVVPAEEQNIVAALDLGLTEERAELLQQLFRAWESHEDNRTLAVELLESWKQHLTPLGRELGKRLRKWQKKIEATPEKERRWMSLPRPTVIATAWRVLATYSTDDPVEKWVLQASIAEMKARRSLPPMIIKKLRTFLPQEATMWLGAHSVHSIHFQYAMSFCLQAPKARQEAA